MEDKKNNLMRKMMRMLEMTADDECGCAHVYEVMDVAAELAAAGKDLTDIMPKVQHHLQMCGDCCAEYEILQQIITASAET